VHRDKDCHAQSANAVQDIRQHGTLAFIAQSRGQADIPFQAHGSLLEVLIFGRYHIIPFMLFYLKVTILTAYSFQTSSKKEGIDLYNPEYLNRKAVLF
jgi:hypothetical protein